MSKKYHRAKAGESPRVEDLEPTDLGASINLAMTLSEVPDTTRWDEKGERKFPACYVLANSQLVDLFYSLFYGVSKRIGKLDFAEVAYLQKDGDSNAFCGVVIDMIVKADDGDDAIKRFNLYITDTPPDILEFAHVKQLTEQFGGILEWKTEVASDEGVFISLTIKLPRAVP